MTFSCDQSGAAPCDIRVRGVAKVRVQDRSWRVQTLFRDEPEFGNPLDVEPAADCVRVEISVSLRSFEYIPNVVIATLRPNSIHPTSRHGGFENRSICSFLVQPRGPDFFHSRRSLEACFVGKLEASLPQAKMRRSAILPAPTRSVRFWRYGFAN